MINRTEHRPTETILRIRNNLKIDSRIKNLKIKLKNSPVETINSRRGNIFVISDGVVRCITNMAPKTQQNWPASAISLASQSPTPTIQLPQSDTSTIQPKQLSQQNTSEVPAMLTHTLPSNSQQPSGTIINNCSPAVKENNKKRKKLRIHPATITNQFHLQTIKNEIRKMKTKYIEYATRKMASSSIHPYILENWT